MTHLKCWILMFRLNVSVLHAFFTLSQFLFSTDATWWTIKDPGLPEYQSLQGDISNFIEINLLAEIAMWQMHIM